MARIRSIKPEFVSDGKVARLSDTCALFFVLLWGHCDDFGYFSWDPKELSLKLPRWTPQAIVGLLSKLSREGLVVLSTKSRVGLVNGWEHQKIKDRRASKWNGLEIEWDPPKIDAVETQKNRPGEDRIGEERSGEDRIYGGAATAAAKKRETRSARSTQISLIEPPAEFFESGTETAGEGGSPTSRAIAKFNALWTERHNGRYPTGGKDVGLIKGFVKSLGEHRTIELFEAYFKMPDAWVVGRKHDVTTLNSNLAKVAAFADTGEFTTHTQVMQMDRTAATMSQLERIRRGEV